MMSDNIVNLIRQAAREVAEQQKQKKANTANTSLFFPTLIKLNNKIREIKLCLRQQV
jgi:hypothetical protein